jgi:GTP cyclohydrolase II
MNSPAVSYDSAFASASSLSKLERAAFGLRRGETIVIRTSAGRFALLAAEGISEQTLSRLQSDDGQPWYLVITGQRAVRIGFDINAQDSVYQLQPQQVMNLQALNAIIDPTMLTRSPEPLVLSQYQLKPCDNIDGVAIQLLKHARLLPAGIIAPLGSQSLPDAIEIDSTDVSEGIYAQAKTLRAVSQARVPLEDSEEVEIISFRPQDGSNEHLAIIVGTPDLNRPVLIRLHSECFTGDLLGSLRCDCGSQLRGAISLMASTEGGILLYLAQEGRGIGLVNKLRAYQLQDTGIDTVDANFELGFEEDERSYIPAVQMLKHLNVRQVRVLTNNPRKVDALGRLGVNVVERVAHIFPANLHNRGYLMTKGARGGHLFNPADFSQDD